MLTNRDFAFINILLLEELFYAKENLYESLLIWKLKYKYFEIYSLGV